MLTKAPGEWVVCLGMWPRQKPPAAREIGATCTIVSPLGPPPIHGPRRSSQAPEKSPQGLESAASRSQVRLQRSIPVDGSERDRGGRW